MCTSIDWMTGCDIWGENLPQLYIYHVTGPRGPAAGLPPHPPDFSTPPPGMQLPDLSKPPPGFPVATPRLPIPPEVDLTPSVPYYELPAGLMAPLVKVKICFHRNDNNCRRFWISSGISSHHTTCFHSMSEKLLSRCMFLEKKITKCSFICNHLPASFQIILGAS